MADTSLMRARPQGPVGLIGLGNMGSAILARLIVGGPVVVFDLDAERQYAAAQLGALPAKSAGDAAKAGADYLVIGRPITMASDAREAACRIGLEIDAAIGHDGN